MLLTLVFLFLGRNFNRLLAFALVVVVGIGSASAFAAAFAGGGSNLMAVVFLSLFAILSFSTTSKSLLSAYSGLSVGIALVSILFSMVKTIFL